MLEYVKTFIADDKGATAIEYGLIAGMICMAVIAGSTTIGKNISSTLSSVAGNMTATK
jgi:pilus assembly protein Flp/PilA